MDETPWWLIWLLCAAVLAVLAATVWFVDGLYWSVRCAFGR